MSQSMNERIKKLWVEALPTYKQGHQYLHQDDEFCCLGVLCDLHAKETGNEWQNTEPDGGQWYQGLCFTLPKVVMEWAGLTDDNPDIEFQLGRTISLVSANDSYHLPLSQIAELIDAQY